MKDFSHLQKTLNKLNEILIRIRIITYAKQQAIVYDMLDIAKKYRLEIDELEQEWNDLKRSL